MDISLVFTLIYLSLLYYIESVTCNPLPNQSYNSDCNPGSLPYGVCLLNYGCTGTLLSTGPSAGTGASCYDLCLKNSLCIGVTASSVECVLYSCVTDIVPGGGKIAIVVSPTTPAPSTAPSSRTAGSPPWPSRQSSARSPRRC